VTVYVFDTSGGPVKTVSAPVAANNTWGPVSVGNLSVNGTYNVVVTAMFRSPEGGQAPFSSSTVTLNTAKWYRQ